ncbi:MAG: ABC transporter permease [Anaerolineae bacterium]
MNTTKSRLQPTTLGQMALMGIRYLSGRKLRTVLTTLAIVFGVALIFAINLTLPTVAALFTSSLSVYGADISISNTTGASFAPEDIVPRVQAVDGVRAASGVLRRQFTLPAVGNELGSVSSIELVGIDPASVEDVRQFAISEGRFLQPEDSGVVVMPAGIAELAPNLTLGTRFPLITAGGLRFYTLVGFTAEQGNLAAPPLYMNLPDVQTAFGQPGLVNAIEIALESGADQEAVTDAVLATLGSGFVANSGGSGYDLFATVQIGLVIMNLFGVLALFLGAFLIFNTFRTIVVERRRDLGMLRAIGATRRQITMMIVIESLLQGIIGTIIGLVLGYLMALALMSVMGGFFETYFPGTEFTLAFNFSALAIAVVLGLLTALLAGYLPARNAGKISPLEALRPAAPLNLNRATRASLLIGVVLIAVAMVMLLAGTRTAVGGALVFLFGVIAIAPALVIPMSRLFSPLLTLWFAREGDLARSNLQRQPGRAAITASTLMVGLAVLILMASLVTAFGVLLTRLSDVNFSSDVIITPPSISVYENVLGADESLYQSLSALPEVATVASLRYASTSVSGTGVEVLGIDPAAYPQVASLSFSQGSAETAFEALGTGRNAVLTGIGATQLNLQVGDQFVLETVSGPQTYTLVGIGDDILSFKIVALFISQENLAADFNKSEDVLLMLNYVEGVEVEAGLEAINSVLVAYPQFTAHATGEYRQTLVETTSAAFGIFYGLAVLILIPAVLGLLNTLTINILERTREIGIVRAVGGSRIQIRRMVTGEALLLGLFGAALGVLAGVAMSYGFIGAFSMIGWEVPYALPIAGIIAAIVVGVLLALFASLLPARSAAKLDIIRALQYE